ILAQAQLEPEPQHFCEVSHGQSFCRQWGFLLVSEEPRLPDSCPASLALTVPLWGEPRRPPLAPGREPNGSRPQGPSPHPGMIITIPGIVITMIPESLLRSFRNAHHDHFGIAITLPRNPHAVPKAREHIRIDSFRARDLQSREPYVLPVGRRLRTSTALNPHCRSTSEFALSRALCYHTPLSVSVTVIIWVLAGI